MKNFITLSVGLLLMIISLGISSCKKEVRPILSHSQTEEFSGKGDNEHMLKTITYYSAPVVGSFTPNSSSSITLPGTSGCGSFSGGMIKAKVLSQSGSSFVIEISPQIGTSFGGSGTAYVKATSVCGTVAGQSNYTSLNTKVNVTINATFTQGVTHFYPVIITSTGARYYAEPVMIYTIPTYTMSSTNGAVMGTVDGVEVRSSGTNSNNGLINQNLNSLNQCTEFCQRYYSQVYETSFSINLWGDAYQWFSTLDTRFEKYSNNGSVAPRVGDIICMSGGSSGYGHVAIINEVNTTQVKLAQQNSGTTWLPIGGNVNRSGNNLTVSGYTVQGWLRKKP